MFEKNIECISIGTLITNMMVNQSSRGICRCPGSPSPTIPSFLTLICQRLGKLSQILLVLPNLGILRQALIAKLPRELQQVDLPHFLFGCRETRKKQLLSDDAREKTENIHRWRLGIFVTAGVYSILSNGAEGKVPDRVSKFTTRAKRGL